MMKLNKNTACILVVFFVLSPVYIPAALAEDLGRLFFTPEERLELDRLRKQNNEPEPLEELVIDVVPEPEAEPQPEVPDIGGITVNGLVYRKGGRSTAWVNNANSYEGDLANRYIRIEAKNIKPDDVEIIIPASDKKLNLKVGEFYEPESGKTIGPEYRPE